MRKKSNKINKLNIMTPREFSTKAQNRYGKILEPNSPEEERVYRNASEVVDMIRRGTMQPAELKLGDRRPVVAYLRLEGHTEDEMAGLFNVSLKTISNDLRAMSEDRTRAMKGLDLFEISGRLVQIAKHLALRARKAGNYATSWKIEKELVESLQGMGFVYRAPKTLGIASVHANIESGHSLLTDKIGGEKDSVVEALGNILDNLKDSSKKERIAYDATDTDEIIEVSSS